MIIYPVIRIINVIHEAFNLPHVSIRYPVHTCPYITAAEQQAIPSTLRDRRTMYSHIGQYDHTLSKKQLYHITHSLYSEAMSRSPVNGMRI